MFGEDRFGESEDFSRQYSSIGGMLPSRTINNLIRGIYEYLSERYPDAQYRHCFPSVEQALAATSEQTYEDDEVRKIIATFAHHELGTIPPPYVQALHTLQQQFVLGAVIDIWSPKAAWLELFGESGIDDFFEATSFSSDHGMVKPSPQPFELVLNQLNLTKTQAIVVGDSPRRDLGGAKNARIDCILVGGAYDSEAFDHFDSLLEFAEYVSTG